jgi:hypothetical protein
VESTEEPACEPGEVAATGEVQLISDGDGLAIVGNSTDVERFLISEGLASKELGMSRLSRALGIGSAGAQAWAGIAANSNRWLKLTKESAQLRSKYGLMKDSVTGLEMGVVHAKQLASGIKGPVRFEGGPGSLLNPSVLSGAGGIMAQLAMQQAIEEITKYLEAIDRKVDDLLRSQMNQVLSRMDAVDLAIKEAMSVRETVGRVSEISWSKVQASSVTILETQALALRQLNDLADKIQKTTKLGSLADAAKGARPEIQKWVAILARCFQLQDAMAVLELDHVLATTPADLDRHRLGLRAARQHRLDVISSSTGRILARMIANVEIANAKVLLHPSTSPALAQSSKQLTSDIYEFRESLGIDSDGRSVVVRRWSDAAAEVRDNVLGAGADGVDAAKRVSSQTLTRARAATGRLSAEIASRTRRPPDEPEEDR